MARLGIEPDQIVLQLAVHLHALRARIRALEAAAKAASGTDTKP